MKLPPLEQDLPRTARDVLAHARRIETPVSAEAAMVWHAWGDADAPPLVLLHGGSGSWTHWLRNVQPLAAAGWHVIVPDLPGFGDSAAPPGARDADGMVEPVATGLRLITQERAVQLVGFSFGGMLGGLVTAAHPHLVKHLVIAGAPALGIGVVRPTLYDWRHLTDAQARADVHRRNLGILMLHDQALIDDDAVALQAANVSRDRMRRRRLAGTDLLAKTLPTLHCRVDAIYGAQDVFYAALRPQLAALLQGFANFGELVFVENAGHWAQYEQPELFDRELLRLLTPAPASAP